MSVTVFWRSKVGLSLVLFYVALSGVAALLFSGCVALLCVCLCVCVCLGHTV